MQSFAPAEGGHGVFDFFVVVSSDVGRGMLKLFMEVFVHALPEALLRFSGKTTICIYQSGDTVEFIERICVIGKIAEFGKT